MTLNDLATLICTKVNQNEAEDLAACKLFLQRRYEMVWNDQLWKDALIDWTYTLPAAGTAYSPSDIWLPTKQNLILPVAFDRVLAVRTDSRRLNVQSAEIFYRSDYDSFQNAGMMADFLVLPPAVWEFDAAAMVSMATNAADAGKTINIDVLDTDASTLVRDAPVVGPATGTAFVDQVLRLDAVTKTVSNSAVTLLGGPVITNSTAEVLTLAFRDAHTAVIQTITLAVGATALFPPSVTVRITSSTGGETHGWAGTTAFFGTLTVFDGPGGFGPLYTVAQDPTTAATIVALAAADLFAKRRQRIHLVGTMDVPAPTIRVLGKAKPNTFTADNDSTALTGVDNALIAIGEYDMLQRERQYSKSQMKLGEFTQLMAQLKQQEVVQMAHNKRIIPEEGYGNPYDLYSHPPLSF